MLRSERSPGKGNATHSSILVWKIPWTGKPDRLQSMGLQKSWTPFRIKQQRVLSGVAAGFSSDDGDYILPPLLALGSPVFHLIGEGKMGVALESMQGQRDLI